jgi:hypothetical protein
MLDRLAEGRATAAQSGTPDLPAGAYFAARRARPIAARLARLPAAQQTTLRAAYGPGLPAPQLTAYPGLGSDALSPTLLLLVAGRTGVSRDKVRLWCGGAKDKESAAAAKAGLSTLRLEATMAITAACMAYGHMVRDEHRAARRAREEEPG